MDKNKKITFLDIVIAMKRREVITIGNVTGYVNGINLEDGSGKCFNISLLVTSGNTVVSVLYREP